MIYIKNIRFSNVSYIFILIIINNLHPGVKLTANPNVANIVGMETSESTYNKVHSFRQ